ncbi:MAG: tetratricopeptide repeat protein [Coleofasciculaceae cyanobacterium RL_1_1]|nr:tetratricopeptide repeat protein [Coleofasciculaceae cyanobacterium RL_1_1]
MPTSIEEFFVELRHMGSTDRIGLFVYTGPCDYRSLLVCLLRVEPYLADRAAIVLAGYEQAGTQQAIADFLNVRLAGCKLDSTAIAEDLPAGVHLLLWDRQAEQSNWPPHVQIYPVDRIVEDPTTSERLAQIDLVRPERLLSMVYDEARFHHAEHRFDRAEVMYQTVLRRDLQHLGAQLNLGFLYYEQGNWDQAIEAFWQTLAHDENKAEAYYGLGLTYAKLGEPAHAIAAYHQALDRQPDHFNALNNLGNLYYDLDHLDRAADLFERAIEAQPQRAGGYLNRARVDLEYHKLEAAIRWYEQGLMRCQPEVERQSWEDLRHSLEVVKRYQIDPCPLYHQLATHATQQTQPRRALRHYHSLYHHQPNPIHARSLIHCHRTLHQHADARTIVIDELSRTPQDVPLNQLAIQIELDLGQFEQAQERAEIAIRQCPNSAKLQLQRVILVPILYESQAQIKRCRADVFAGLSWLEQEIDRSLASMSFVNPENPASFVNPENSVNSESPANLEQHGSGRAKQTDDPGLIAITPSEWLEAIAQQTNFGLSYQGYDDRPFQERYGRLIRRLVCAVYPEFAAVKTQYRHDRILPRHRLKIGYVSSSMGPSRLGELTIGWIEHHDRQQFEIFGYYTQSSCDALTARFRQACDHFRHFPDRDLTTIAQTIANDRLDLLIFTDLGIDPLLGVLAAMRLASVQCTSWSHPITTGLETIDYFLSSVAMETEISDSHYSETLVRLADIGIVFPRPVFPNALPSQPHSNTESPATVAAPVTPSADDVSSPRSSLRQQLGLGITKTLFLCCQSLFKYLPQDDPIWAAIAAGVPDAQLVFIAHPSPQITQRFRQRLERSFAEQGLDFDRLAIILPRLSEADYLRVNQCCDVFLDSFHWSGGVTTLKAIACGLPVVTCAGELMRSRHSAGILQTLGMTETIAVTPVDYIDLAVRLAHDRVWRQQIRDQIMVRQDRLYDNSACVQDLEALAIGQIFPQKQQPLVT